MDKNKFNDIMAHAQQLMLDENFNQKVNSKAYSFKKGGNMPNSDITALERGLFNDGTTQDRQPTIIQESGVSTKKGINALPECLRESFKKMPPIQGESQISDVLNIKPVKQNINEISQMPNVISQQPQKSGIDYSLIKTIIDESVKKYVGKLGKNILNENVNTIKGIGLTNGNKIQVVDSKGNLYEGVLTLKKRAKK